MTKRKSFPIIQPITILPIIRSKRSRTSACLYFAVEDGKAKWLLREKNMGGDRFRVLTDLSFAKLGYCGIAQESRLLLKSLCQTDLVEPTGLVFGRDDAVASHRFVNIEERGRRKENQGLFLQSLLDGRPPDRISSLRGRWFRKLKTICKISPRIDRQSLDLDSFWDLIWRNLLSRSLNDDDIAIARHCPMLLANLGGSVLQRQIPLRPSLPYLDTSNFEFALFHTATPIRVNRKTCKLIRYYDLIPGLRPDLVDSGAAVRNHFRDIRRCLNDSIFVCISTSAQADLLQTFPELTQRTVCIPVVLSDAYFPEYQPRLLPRIIASRVSNAAATHSPAAIQKMVRSEKMPPYVLMASTLEPRKNYILMMRAFEQLTATHRSDLRLVFVGNPGWKNAEILKAMAPLIRQRRLFHLENVATPEMRVLYSHAEALVFPSLYEGFGYTPLEAMACDTPTIVSDIAAHRYVYGDSVLYCDPYRISSLVKSLESLLFNSESSMRIALVARGRERLARYSSQVVGAQWAKLFHELRRQGVGADIRNARLANLDLNVSPCDNADFKLVANRITFDVLDRDIIDAA